MAVRLEFINLIIPVQAIEVKCPDGWSGCLRDHTKSIGRVVWYDDHLFRTGAMDPEMMDNLITKWTRLGFEATEVVDEKVVWKDFCVVDSFRYSRHSCNWLTFDPTMRAAWLRGTDPGEVVWRERFQRYW